MIDTHCHVFGEYFEDISKVIDELKLAGVNKIIINGVDMNTNLEILKLINEYDCVYGALGFHPTELDDFKDEYLDWLEEHINHNKIVAIGEIGLDYHYENTDKNKQIDVFKKQLKMACKYNKPVIIHSRDAIQDTYNTVSQFPVKGSIHAYSGSLEMASNFIKKGFYIGVGGVLTFKNAKKLVDVVKEIDLAYLLLETDSPYLSPEPYRGKINTPSNIPVIAKSIANIKGITEKMVQEVTTENAYRLFDF